MYRALESFTTGKLNVKRKELLEDDFTTQDEIQDLLSVGYIEVDTGAIKITWSGTITQFTFINFSRWL